MTKENPKFSIHPLSLSLLCPVSIYDFCAYSISSSVFLCFMIISQIYSDTVPFSRCYCSKEEPHILISSLHALLEPRLEKRVQIKNNVSIDKKLLLVSVNVCLCVLTQHRLKEKPHSSKWKLYVWI